MAMSPIKPIIMKSYVNNNVSEQWGKVAEEYHKIGELADGFAKVLDDAINRLNNVNIKFDKVCSK
jgi:hypothetical protein